MVEYIERNALYEKIARLEELARNRVVDTPSTSPAYMRYVAQLNERTALKHLIFDTPAADVAPVAHGRWEFRQCGTYSRRRAYCSACKKHSGIGGIIENQMKPYCPNCGAKMDLVAGQEGV